MRFLVIFWVVSGFVSCNHVKVKKLDQNQNDSQSLGLTEEDKGLIRKYVGDLLTSDDPAKVVRPSQLDDMFNNRLRGGSLDSDERFYEGLFGPKSTYLTPLYTEKDPGALRKFLFEKIDENFTKVVYPDFLKGIDDYFRGMGPEEDALRKYMTSYFSELSPAERRQIYGRAAYDSEMPIDFIVSKFLHSERPLLQKIIQGAFSVLSSVTEDDSADEALMRFKRITEDLPHEPLSDLREQVSRLKRFNGKKVEVSENKILGTGTVASTVVPQVDGKDSDIVVKVYNSNVHTYIENERKFINGRKDLTDLEKLQLNQLMRKIEKELDPNFELKNTQRGERTLARYKDQGVRVPRAYIDSNCERCLIQTRASGATLSQDTARKPSDSLTYDERITEIEIQSKKLFAYQTAMGVWMDELLFGSGFVHGDPHPGNLMFNGNVDGKPGFEITFIDWGRTIEFKSRDKASFLSVLQNASEGNVDKTVQSMVELTDTTGYSVDEKNNFDRIVGDFKVKVQELFTKAEFSYYSRIIESIHYRRSGSEFSPRNFEGLPIEDLYEQLKEISSREMSDTDMNSFINESKKYETKFKEINDVFKTANGDRLFSDDRYMARMSSIMEGIENVKLPIKPEFSDAFRGLFSFATGIQKMEASLSTLTKLHLANMNPGDLENFIRMQVDRMPRWVLEEKVIRARMLKTENSMSSKQRVIVEREVSEVSLSKLKQEVLNAELTDKVDSNRTSALKLATEPYSLQRRVQEDFIPRLGKSAIYTQSPFIYQFASTQIRSGTGVNLPSGTKLMIGGAGVAAAFMAGASYILYKALEEQRVQKDPTADKPDE